MFKRQGHQNSINRPPPVEPPNQQPLHRTVIDAARPSPLLPPRPVNSSTNGSIRKPPSLPTSDPPPRRSVTDGVTNSSAQQADQWMTIMQQEKPHKFKVCLLSYKSLTPRLFLTYKQLSVYQFITIHTLYTTVVLVIIFIFIILVVILPVCMTVSLRINLFKCLFS